MRDYFRTRTIAIPIPTEPELYIIMAAVIGAIMWMVVSG